MKSFVFANKYFASRRQTRPKSLLRSPFLNLLDLEARVVPSSGIAEFRTEAHPMNALIGSEGSQSEKIQLGGLFSPKGSPSPSASSKTPAQIRKAYGFDLIADGAIVGDGSGQTIAVIAAHDNPNILADLTTFSSQYNLPAPNASNFIKVDQNGGTNYPAADATWAGEIALDVEWIHAMAPQATILLVEADSAFSDLDVAVNYAKSYPGVSVVSMSYGSTEYSQQVNDDSIYTSLNGHPVTFVASSGDDAGIVNYPASSPNVVAVGGTSLYLNASNGYLSEKAWGYRNGSGTGGGVSVYETKPGYQSGVALGGNFRTVPDVALNADPNTGVAVCDSYNGGSTPWYTVGGTSFSAPVWSSLIAIANQFRSIESKPLLDGPTDTLSGLYSMDVNNFRDVTTGSAGKFKAAAGYDLTTGLGTPKASSVVAALAGTTAPFFPPDGDVAYLNTKSAYYYEPDGDKITVTFSAPIVTPGNVTSILKTAASGNGYILQKLDLTSTPGSAGTGITITATRTKAGSDGLASIGLIDATGVDLGLVTIGGDLGKILAGDVDPTTAAIAGLTATTLGRLGTTTQASGGNLQSVVTGGAKTIKINGTVASGTSISVTGGAANGYVNTLSVAGSFNGSLNTDGDVKTVGISGSVSGSLVIGRNLTNLNIAGSVTGTSGSGKLIVNGNATTIKVVNSLLGGSASGSGSILVNGSATTISIGKDIIGGFASADNDTPTYSGSVRVGTRIGTMTVGGSLVSGTTNGFASVDLTGTGLIASNGDIGSLTIMRNVIGRDVSAVISARQQTLTGLGLLLTDTAITSLVIKGSVIDASILAGYDWNGVAVNGSAQVGSVSVTGDLIRSSILVGTDSSAVAIGTKQKPGTLAKISSVTVGGQIYGGNTGAKSFYITAEQIGSLKISGVNQPLVAGAHNDNFSIGYYNQFFVREV